MTIATASMAASAAEISPSIASSTRRRERAVLLCLSGVLLLAGVVRFYGLDREGFWGDEYLQFSTYSSSPQYTAYYAVRDHAMGPLDFLIGWAAYRISPTVWMCRLPAAIWGVAGVLLCYLLTKRLAGPVEGVVAATLLTFCSMHVALSQEVRPYSMCAALLLATLVQILRVFDEPTLRRIIEYAVVAYMCSLTLSLTPLVFLFVIGLVLTVSLLSAGRSSDSIGRCESQALRRLWVVTLLVGMASGALVVLMIMWTPYSVFSDGYNPNHYDVDNRFVPKLIHNAATMWRSVVSSYGLFAVLMAGVGVLTMLKLRKALSLPKRCMQAILLSAAPMFLVIFSLTAEITLYKDRYSFFVMPIVAVFAAMGSVGLGRCLLAVFKRRRRVSGVVVTGFVIALLAHPAIATATTLTSYHKRDWRGCAAYLGERITNDDVVMVLSERPFGRPQHRFFGKYEWPQWLQGGTGDRPLAEAMWTLVQEDSHFKRLCAKTGRCFLVLCYPMHPQERSAYLAQGLAATPAGYQLAKFRGLEVLYAERRGDSLLGEVLSICRDLTAMQHEHASTVSIPMAMQARILLHLGRRQDATTLLDEASKGVPPSQMDWFNHGTEWMQPDRIR